MTQQTRMLAVLGVLGFGGAIALMVMATRYGKILEGRIEARPRSTSVASAGRSKAPTSGALGGFGRANVTNETMAETLRRVDAFIAVRRTLLDGVERQGPAAPEPDDRSLTALREVRDRAADRAGLALEDYLDVLAAYREWKSGRRGAAAGVLFTALDLRRADLEPLDLGPFERADL